MIGRELVVGFVGGKNNKKTNTKLCTDNQSRWKWRVCRITAWIEYDWCDISGWREGKRHRRTYPPLAILLDDASNNSILREGQLIRPRRTEGIQRLANHLNHHCVHQFWLSIHHIITKQCVENAKWDRKHEETKLKTKQNSTHKHTFDFLPVLGFVIAFGSWYRSSLL